jgi:hypothetical protein
MPVRPVIEKARALGLPTEPLARTTATLYYSGRGIYHIPTRLSLACGKPFAHYKEVSVTPDQHIAFCKRCESKASTSVWGSAVARYIAVLHNITGIEENLESLSSVASTNPTPDLVRHLENLRRRIERLLGDSDLEFETLEFDDPRALASRVGEIRARWEQMIETLVPVAAHGSAAGCVAKFEKVAARTLASEKSRFDSMLHHAIGKFKLTHDERTTSTVRTRWVQMRAFTTEPITLESYLTDTEKNLGHRPDKLTDQLVHLVGGLTPRFAGSEFTSPIEWARAEWAAHIREIVGASLEVLESSYDTFSNATRNAVVFLAEPCESHLAQDLTTVVAPLASSKSSRALAYRLPWVAARFLGEIASSQALCTAEDIDDELVRLTVGLYDPDPGSGLSRWGTVLATAEALT